MGLSCKKKTKEQGLDDLTGEREALPMGLDSLARMAAGGATESDTFGPAD